MRIQYEGDGHIVIYCPQPELHLPYFPNETIAKCEQDVKRVLGVLPYKAAAHLKKCLLLGRINGVFKRTDLFAILSEALMVEREALLQSLGDKPIYDAPRKKMLDYLQITDQEPASPARYWFMQIGPLPIIDGAPARNFFAEMALKWCDEALAKKAHETITPVI